ncbi:unnamed protein product [Adineta steineri]|uniref:Uncharacterized protein n=1 Tax=Adineta steineri TaxID=433720 RepID=A0A818PYT3_9BILA|nr:unnamed protein product [Adineta steineri]CAF3629401.1 unnamed protein product [Adineta steineri]
MTNIISAGIHAVDRPRLCRSDHQPNLLEYIDTTLNESFSLNVALTQTISNGYDHFGNTILDQYLLYLLCQKIHPNRSDHLTYDLYQLLHQLVVLNGKISKSFFEYSPPNNNRAIYHTIFNSYANFIWNEFNVNVLLELGCFLLKYRLRDIFTVNIGNTKTYNNNNLIRQKMIGYFLEIIVIYYLSSHHHDYFIHSRSIDMIFPSPALYPALSDINQFTKNNEQETFRKFLHALHINGEIYFDISQIKHLLQSDAYQFINKKLENKKIDFINFFERNITFQQKNSCRSLKSICRVCIKMHIKQYPNDIKQLPSFPSINERLQDFLTYENKFTFQSYV